MKNILEKFITDSGVRSFDKEYRKRIQNNISIYDSKVNAIDFNFNIDFRNFIEDGYFRKRISQGGSSLKFGGNIFISNSKTLKSNLDFIQYNFNLDGALSTFKSAKFIFKIFSNYSDGPIPYQMLYALPGNLESVSKNWTFRTVRMNEYFGDKFAILFIEHQFNDELFRLLRIPYVEDLELQLTGLFNIGWLGISEKSKSILPVAGKELNKPLIETGFGIGHVLFPIRLEFVWRLNHLENNKFVISLNTFIL